jgi:hypothetical protein
LLSHLRDVRGSAINPEKISSGAAKLSLWNGMKGNWNDSPHQRRVFSAKKIVIGRGFDCFGENRFRLSIPAAPAGVLCAMEYFAPECIACLS